MVVKSAKIPRTGETVLGGVFSQHQGGKGANQAVAAKTLFDGVAFCAGIGEDAIGREYIDYLKKRGLDLSLTKTYADAHTGVALITVAKEGQNIITVAPGANLLLSPALWKIIAGETVDETDLEWIDASLSRFLKQCRNGELETTWSFPSFQGTLRVHRDYPPDSIVEPREIEEFCGWVLREAFAAQKRLCGAFRAGFDEVLCGVLQGILRGSEYRELIAGIGDVDVSELRRMTKFEGFLASDREIAWFWRVLGEMSRAQRVKFLQFATARSRLPVFSHQTPLAVG